VFGGVEYKTCTSFGFRDNTTSWCFTGDSCGYAFEASDKQFTHEPCCYDFCDTSKPSHSKLDAGAVMKNPDKFVPVAIHTNMANTIGANVIAHFAARAGMSVVNGSLCDVSASVFPPSLPSPPSAPLFMTTTVPISIELVVVSCTHIGLFPSIGCRYSFLPSAAAGGFSAQ
jgi:hypothetical protein